MCPLDADVKGKIVKIQQQYVCMSKLLFIVLAVRHGLIQSKSMLEKVNKFWHSCRQTQQI